MNTLKVLESHPITQEIMVEVLQLAMLTGQRIYVEKQQYEPTEEWTRDHMLAGRQWSDVIREKLDLPKKYAIAIDFNNGAINVLNRLVKNVAYHNNIEK